MSQEFDDNFELLPCSELKTIKEAQGCISIKSIQEYSDAFKDKKPIEIYLQHCKEFSNINLKRESLCVNEYRFSEDDFFELDEKPIKGPQVLSQDIIAQQMTVDKNRIKDQFKNEYFRLFKNIVFVNGQQMLLVKTWQKVRFQEVTQGSDESEKSDTPVTQSRFFHIKTLKIYDTQNHLITDIMLEQVEGDFDRFRIYDASYLQLNQFIYYYKRLRDMKKDTQLKLFKYDLLSFKEYPMPESYTINEANGAQFNLIFSEKFGVEKKKHYKDEKEFLADQYISLQDYIEDWGQRPTEILCLGCIKEPCCTTVQSDKMHQVQQLNQISNYRGEGEDKVHFILVNMIWTITISYDKKTKSVTPKKYKNTDSFQKIWNPDVQVQKIQLQVYDQDDQSQTVVQYFFLDSKNKIQLLYPNYSQKVERIKFIEQIADQMSLNTGDDQIFKKITLLTEETSTGLTINFEDDHDQHDCEDRECQIVNSILEIEHLRMILNLPDKKLGSPHILTYCEDKEDQILYITEAKSQFIEWIYLKDHHCEETLIESTQVAPEGEENQQDNIPANIANLMKQILQNVKGRMILSRKKNSVNLLQTYLHESICSLCVNKDEHFVVNFNLQEQNERANKIAIARQLSSLSSLNNRNSDLGRSLRKKMSMVFSKTYDEETLTKDEQSNHIIVQDLQGKKTKIRTHTLPEEKMSQMSLIIYVKTQNHYFFIFMVTNERDNIEKHSYIFVRKSFQEMSTIFNGSTLFTPLIEDYAEVLLLRGPNLLEILFFVSISDHQQGSDYIDIKLTLVKVNDENQAQNFIPFIYQEYQNIERNQIIVFDIYKLQLSCQTSINPSKEMMQYIYEDDNGFNVFQLCRSSDIIEEDIFRWYSKRGGLPRDMKKQTAKFQVFTLSKEKLGIILGLEYLITFSNHQCKIQQIGQKLLFLSNKAIQECDWIHVRKSQVIPFYDANGSIKGCQYIFKSNKDEQIYINMLEQELNNIYTYESNVVQIGHKKFMTNQKDTTHFILIASVILRQDLINQSIFERSEVYFILKHMQERFLGAKVPNLRYMVMNDFNMQKELDFFKCQEILLGQSICDICLSDPASIKKAINQHPDKISSNIGSIIHKLSKGDRVRKDTFEQVGLSSNTLVISADLNFMSTIERGVSQNNILSVRILLKQIFQKINSQDYINLIMMDLPCIMSQARLTINEFFERSQTEFMERETQGFCNMEIPFVNDELPVFSNLHSEYEIISQFKNFHDFKNEMIFRVRKRDKNKPEKIEKNIEVEHHYIDFQIMQIREKLRHEEAYLKGKLKFNNLYYAKLLTQNPEENLDFYLKETTQKIIDSQYQRTKQLLSTLFMLYLLCYCLPFLVILFSKDEHNLHNAMGRLCLVTQIAFFGIELIQFREQGLNYFMGWNIIDFSQFWVYCMFYYFRFVKEHPQNQDFMPQVHFMIVMLSFIKFLFFIRIYQEYGFLVQMVILTIKDLVPFFFSFIISMVFFAMCFYVLNAEIDEEIEGSKGPLLTFFGLTMLQVYRISIGEIGNPKYDALMSRPDGFFKDTNIVLIWMTWYFNTFFMIVILLNFLIAVISQSYERVIEQQNIYSYMHKSELNEECYQLLSVFTHLKEYKVIIFSYSKDHYTNADENEDNQHIQNLFYHLKSLIKKESKKSQAVVAETIEKQNDLDEKVKNIANQVNKIQADQLKMKNEILAALKAKK